MALIFRGGGFAPPGGGTPGTWTWDPANTNVNADLSGGNLTATADPGIAGSAAAIYGTNSFSSLVKPYWEILCNYGGGTGFDGVGISNGVPGHASGNLPHDGNNGMVYFGNGLVYVNGTNIASFAGVSSGQFIGIAVDGPNDKIWFYDGTHWNNDVLSNQNPASNVGGLGLAANSMNAGPYFPSADFYQTPFQAMTANFGATTFNYTIPSGFVAANTLP